MINFIKVPRNRENRLYLLKDFYNNVYIESFSNKDEMETEENLQKYLELNETNRKCDYSIVLAYDKGALLGGIIYDYFKDINTLVIEFIAVNKKYQRQGVGSAIYKYILDKYKPSQVFIEINKPECSEDKCYLYFWKKHNFKIIDFDYIQPPLEESKKEVYDLNLATNAVCVNKKILFKVLRRYFKYAFLLNPYRSKEYRKMYNTVNDPIGLKDIEE